jgi:hypothetical protein
MRQALESGKGHVCISWFRWLAKQPEDEEEADEHLD